MTEHPATAARRPGPPAEPAPPLRRRSRWGGRTLVVAVPFVWLLLFFLVPFAIVLSISLAEQRLAQPPYTPLVEWTGDGMVQLRLNFANFLYLLTDSVYAAAYLNSLKYALVSTLLCLALGYPMAYAIARAERRWRAPLLLLIVLPFWTSFLLRVYSWIAILKPEGLLNNLLIWLGVIDRPLTILYTDTAVYVGMVYSYLPFMILPLYATLERLDGTLLEAAADLGSRPFATFLQVTLPLSIPGIVAGSLLVFIPAVGEFVIPELLGGPDALMIGRQLWSEYFNNRDWPVASAVAIALLLFLVIPIMVLQWVQGRQQEKRA